MSVMTLEGFFQHGVIHLSPAMNLPEMTKVFIIVPAIPIVTKLPSKCRIPAEQIAGKGQILGDIISETSENDWDVLQ